MNTRFFAWCCGLLLVLTGCASPMSTPITQPEPQAYWPDRDWRTSTPEEQGMDSETLIQMFQEVGETNLNLHSVLIVRNGYLVTEAYFHPYTQDQPQYLASVTKSVIGALVGIAIDRGYIQDANQPLVSFFPDQRIDNLDDRKKSMTLSHLLSLTAGLACNDAPFSGQPGMEQSDDWVQFMLDQPMAEEPGTKFNYCAGAVHLLSAVIQNTTGMTARAFANQVLFDPLGIAEVPETGWGSDPQGISAGPYGLYLTPLDMARLGYLYLQNGLWDGKQVLPQDWVAASTTAHTSKDDGYGYGYGYLWTVDPKDGAYSALGFAGQQIHVFPKQNLVVVFTGALRTTEPNMDFVPLRGILDRYILPAVQSDQHLPSNPSSTAQLTAKIHALAQPIQPVQPIPPAFLDHSGMVFAIDPNPMGLETLMFDFQSGENVARLTINGVPVEPPVGLDHLFRMEQLDDGTPPTALRGFWENDTTWIVQQIELGELMDLEFQIEFEIDEIRISAQKIVDGAQVQMHGRWIE